MFYQRVMSAKYNLVVRTFIMGGLVFGIVPIVLSVFGFIAANSALHGMISVVDPQMVSVAVVQHFLPKWTLFVFAFMVLCALCSTLDASYIAIGSLWSIDIYRRYQRPDASDKAIVRVSKSAMLMFAIAGTAIAMLPGIKLLWVFFINGALASSALVPTVLSLFWGRLAARGAFWGVFLSFVIGLPVSIYANFHESPHLVVLSSVLSVAIGLVVCLADGFSNRGQPFDFQSLPGKG
jgi:Na+/proline symporter